MNGLSDGVSYLLNSQASAIHIGSGIEKEFDKENDNYIFQKVQ